MAEESQSKGMGGAEGRKRRDLVELCVGYGLILLVIWTPRPWQRALYWAPVLWILVVSWRSFDGWAAMGLRRANLLRSLWIVGLALLLAAIAAAAASQRGTLHLPHGVLLFAKTYIGYIVWSFVQQFLLLVFFLGRLLRLLRGRISAVLVTAAIFALAHVPNPILTPATLLWGVVACLLFLRYRNVSPLAITHAILGICIAITLPARLTHNMRVGLGYLTYRPHGHLHRSHSDHIVSTPAWVIADAPTRRC